jgi:hypothetical protein
MIFSMNRKPEFLCLLLGILLLVKTASAQEYIYISEEGIRKLLRVNAGVTQWSITPKDSSASHSAVGIHLSNEVKIVSGFWDKKKEFTIHDAFYFDLNMGLMTTDPRSKTSSLGNETESKFSMCANFGYLGLVGYREKKWAALAGIDFRWRMASIGGFSMPNLDGPLLYFSRPLVLRGEYCLSKSIANKRAILMLWYAAGSGERMPYQSLRLELPLGDEGRWWLCGQYTHQEGLTEDNFSLVKPFNASFNQWMLGVRIGNLP